MKIINKKNVTLKSTKGHLGIKSSYIFYKEMICEKFTKKGFYINLLNLWYGNEHN